VLVAHGIPAARVSTISYGKERPEIPHSDDSSYAQNRRGVTTVN
jgi:peptidoglycan-associated lipoprotein